MYIAKRYYVGEDITLIRLFYREGGKRRYLRLSDIVTRCINKDVKAEDILFDTLPLTVEKEIRHTERDFGFIGKWTIDAKINHTRLGLNRAYPSRVDGMNQVLDITWSIFEHRFSKTRAYEAVDLRYAATFLKHHESVVYPLIRSMNKSLGRL